jgi:hypothetical protein
VVLSRHYLFLRVASRASVREANIKAQHQGLAALESSVVPMIGRKLSIVLRCTKSIMGTFRHSVRRKKIDTIGGAADTIRLRKFQLTARK